MKKIIVATALALLASSSFASDTNEVTATGDRVIIRALANQLVACVTLVVRKTVKELQSSEVSFVEREVSGGMEVLDEDTTTSLTVYSNAVVLFKNNRYPTTCVADVSGVHHAVLSLPNGPWFWTRSTGWTQ